MRRKKNILVTQEGWERYVDEEAAGVTSILQNDDDFVNAAAKFDAETVKESAEMACSQRVENITGHTMENADNRK